MYGQDASKIAEYSSPFMVASSAGSASEFKRENYPEIRSLQNGEHLEVGQFYIEKVSDVEYIVDLEKLGFTFMRKLAKALRSSASGKRENGSADPLNEAMMPMIWSPYRGRSVSQMSDLEVVPGFYLEFKEQSGKAQSLDYVKPLLPGKRDNFFDVSDKWREGFDDIQLELRNVSYSCGGSKLPPSDELKAIYDQASEIVWIQYQLSKNEYNEAMEQLRQTIMPKGLPFPVGDFLDGKKFSELPKEYEMFSSYLTNSSNLGKDWADAKITKAIQDTYIRGQLIMNDGRLENFQFQLPPKIK